MIGKGSRVRHSRNGTGTVTSQELPARPELAWAKEPQVRVLWDKAPRGQRREGWVYTSQLEELPA